MKIAAIISEYNPFHNGHAKQFRLIRERLGGDTVIVCLMSGNFVQRGEPALLPKAVRAEAAVACGADLVLELPVTAALSSAEGFAAGGVRLLDALGVVDELCSGAETADRDALWQTAACLRTPAFSEALRRELAGGISFAAARSRALAQLGAAPEVVRQPNDILAVEYCKALQALGSQIEPAVFLRQGAYHAVLPEGENPSATSLRELARPEAWAAYVPAAALAVYARHPAQYRRENGERAMLAVLRRMPEAGSLTLLVGMLRDKNTAACAALLGPLCRHIVCCTPGGTDRALPGEELAAQMRPYCPETIAAAAPGEALELAWEKAAGGPLLIAGSFYLCRELRPRLQGL